MRLRGVKSMEARQEFGSSFESQFAKIGEALNRIRHSGKSKSAMLEDYLRLGEKTFAKNVELAKVVYVSAIRVLDQEGDFFLTAQQDFFIKKLIEIEIASFHTALFPQKLSYDECLSYGIEAYEQEEWALAFVHFSSTILKNPRCSKSYGYRAIALAKLGKNFYACLDMSIAIWLVKTKMDFNSTRSLPDYFFNRAIMYLRSGNVTQARVDYESVLTLAQEEEKVIFKKFYFAQLCAEADIHRDSEKENITNYYIEAYRVNPAAFYLEEQIEKETFAYTTLVDLKKLNPTVNYKILINTARMLFIITKPSVTILQKITLLEEARAKGCTLSPSLLIQLGSYYLSSPSLPSYLEKALNVLTIVIEKETNSKERCGALAVRVLVYQELKMFQKSREDLLEIFRSPHSQFLVNHELWERIIAAYRECECQLVTIPDVYNSLPITTENHIEYYLKGKSFYVAKDFAAAFNYFNKLIQLFPTHSLAYDGRARCYFKKGQYSFALDDHTLSIWLIKNRLSSDTNIEERENYLGTLSEISYEHGIALFEKNKYLPVSLAYLQLASQTVVNKEMRRVYLRALSKIMEKIKTCSFKQKEVLKRKEESTSSVLLISPQKSVSIDRVVAGRKQEVKRRQQQEEKEKRSRKKAERAAMKKAKEIQKQQEKEQEKVKQEKVQALEDARQQLLRSTKDSGNQNSQVYIEKLLVAAEQIKEKKCEAIKLPYEKMSQQFLDLDEENILPRLFEEDIAKMTCSSPEKNHLNSSVSSSVHLGAREEIKSEETVLNVVGTVQLPERVSQCIRSFQSIHPKRIFFLVGGYPRDKLLNIAESRCADIDFFTNASKEQIHKHFSSYLIRECEQKPGLFIFHLDKMKVDLWQSKVYDKKNPYLQDAEKRDFTINTFIVDANGNVFTALPIAIGDLQNRLLRTVIPAEQCFQEDPRRILRAIHLICKLKLNLHSDIEPAAKRHAGLLVKQLNSIELTLLLKKLFCQGYAFTAFQTLLEWGIFKQLFPTIAVNVHREKLENIFKKADEEYHLNPAFKNINRIYAGILRLSTTPLDETLIQNAFISFSPDARARLTLKAEASYFTVSSNNHHAWNLLKENTPLLTSHTFAGKSQLMSVLFKPIITR